MATADEKAQIAVLNTQMATVLVALEQINKKLDAQEAKYVLVAVYEPRMAELENKVNTALSKRWVQNTLSAILGSILTVLIGYFLLDIGTR